MEIIGLTRQERRDLDLVFFAAFELFRRLETGNLVLHSMGRPFPRTQLSHGAMTSSKVAAARAILEDAVLHRVAKAKLKDAA